jgi:hypothetical protein
MDYIHKPTSKFQSETASVTVGPIQPVLYQNLELHPTKLMQENMLMNAEKQQL